MRLLCTMFLVTAFASAQLVQVGPVDPRYCDKEGVAPNLELQVRQEFSGTLRDQTGEPFKLAKIEVRWTGADGTQQVSRSVTDSQGRFRFESLAAGRYRFVASASRLFQQPNAVVCKADEAKCQREITLKANPTDQPYMFCPVK